MTTYNKQYYDAHKTDKEWMKKRAVQRITQYHKTKDAERKATIGRLVRDVMLYDDVEKAEGYVMKNYRVFTKCK